MPYWGEWRALRMKRIRSGTPSSRRVFIHRPNAILQEQGIAVVVRAWNGRLAGV